MKSIYSADEPVLKKDQDVFQRYEFSKRIAKTIQNDKVDECKVIGLYGAWGEGKTSVLNFITEELSNDTTIKTIKFNPWRYKGEEELLVSFFKIITKSLDKNLYTSFESISKKADKNKFLGPIINAIIKYFAGPSSKIDVSDLFRILSTTDVELLKARVNNYLKESSHNLVVIIDDIDRLDKNEIYSIMKMVKLTTDFVKTTYILSFDDRMVASAIGERFTTGDIKAGYNFLEKIIQVPIRLPQIQLSDLRKYCLTKIYEGLNKNKINISEDDTKRFERVFEQSIIPRLNNPRLAVRYANSLSFCIPILYGEINTVDFMLIEGLKLFYPDHYEYVKNNSDSFINYRYIDNILYSNDEIDFSKDIFDLIPNISSKDKIAILSLLKHLFPVIEKYYDKENHFGIIYKRELYSEKRVASIEYFRRYFTYSLGDKQIADTTISEFIKSLSKNSNKQIIDEIKTLIAESSVDEFLMKMSHITESLDWHKVSNLILSIIKVPELFNEINEGIFLESPSLRNRLSVLIFDKLMKIEDTTVRYEIAENIMTGADDFNLAYHINNELRRKFKDDEQLFSPDEYNKLGSILRNRAMTEAGDLPLFQSIQKINQIQYLFNNWNITDPVELQNYVSNIINKDPEKIKYLIMAFTPEASNLNDGKYRKANFTEGYFTFLDNLINTTEVYDLILQHTEYKIRKQPVKYIDEFMDSEIQTYDNVILQFIECYERKNEIPLNLK